MPCFILAAAPLEELQRPLVVRDGLLVGELGRAVAGEVPKRMAASASPSAAASRK